MYTINAKEGKVKKDFNLNSMINKANNLAETRIKNNEIVRNCHKELARDYLKKLNTELENIGVRERFKISGDHTFSNTISLSFGHGNARTSVVFHIEQKDKVLSADLKCYFVTYHYWATKENGGVTTHKRRRVKSVGQIINKMEFVIKYFLISENVPDFTEQSNLHKQLAIEVQKE